jgi:hypothetical protein
MICAHCGKDGGHGFRGLSRCPFEHGSGHAVRQDTLIGGFLAENAWREPRYFDSQKTYERALADSGLMLKERRPRHGRTIDAQTLANAERLVRRGTSDGIDTRVMEATLTVQADT